ncbi:MAG: beta-ketoacyl-ACP synthase III [Alphaproteobacteria bacterium]
MQFPLLTAAAALPRTCVSNAQLTTQLAEKGVVTSPEWIESRTGIQQRYVCEADETTFTLARDAALKALAQAGISPTQLGVIVVATCTPDLTFPSVAAMVHGAIGAGPTCAAMDINGACSGFLMALATAKGLLMQGHGTHALIIGADTFSHVLDWSDRNTCILFGDGAGAVIMSREDTSETSSPPVRHARAGGHPGFIPQTLPRGLLGVSLGTDGTQTTPLQSTGGVATTQTAGVTTMDGKRVFLHAVRQMGQTPPLLAELGLSIHDIDLLIPHQANARIIEAAAHHMGLPMSKVVLTVPHHANTSAASIPLAMAHALGTGHLHTGQTVLLQAFGAGFAWGSAVIRW